ncbi:unnamed protein product [Absidia cylindrospora]
MTEDKITTATTTSEQSSPSLSITTITTENDGSSSPAPFIVDDAELLSILADPSDISIDHADVPNSDDRIETPTVAILDWQDWNQDVPEFPNDNNKKRKRGDTPLESDDDEEDEFNFLDQFDFVDATFDYTPTTENDMTSPTTNTKKQKTNNFVNDNVEDLSSLLKQSDSLIDDLDYRWVLDITS